AAIRCAVSCRGFDWLTRRWRAYRLPRRLRLSRVRLWLSVDWLAGGTILDGLAVISRLAFGACFVRLPQPSIVCRRWITLIRVGPIVPIVGRHRVAASAAVNGQRTPQLHPEGSAARHARFFAF